MFHSIHTVSSSSKTELVRYTYKFLRDIIFADDQNLGDYIFEGHLLSTLVSICIVNKFRGLNFQG